MKGSKQIFPFRKTAACPSASTLVSFSRRKLSKQSATLVGYHLNACEFCGAELTLLAHYPKVTGRDLKTPEIPRDLRILAESILNRA